MKKNLPSPSTKPSISKPFDPQEALDKIDKEVTPLLWPPFNNVLIGPVKCKRLRHAEIAACGDFSLIETFYDKVRAKEIKRADMSGYAKIQHAILRKALLSPTYDDILKVVGQYENLEACKEQLKAFRLEVDREEDPAERKKKQRELEDLEMQYYSVLPADFTGFIMAFALQIAETDIKAMGDEILMEAATLAKLNNNRPSDNIGGAFTDFNRADIDKRAWGLWLEKNKDNNGNRRRNR